MLRQSVASAAALFLCLQILLSPVGLGRILWQPDANSELFVVCHGSGGKSEVSQNGPVRQPRQDAHCALCTLSNLAALPVAPAVASVEADDSSVLVVPCNAQVIQHDSPNGEYQRGPPALLPFAA